MIHNYPYTDFHELNLDYLMKLARESMGLHFEQADKFLKLVNAQGQEVSRAKIYYAETALTDDLGNNIDAYIISTSLQGDNIIFTKGNGEYTTVTIPYAVKASKDVNNIDLTSYIHGLSVAGDKLLITYGNGETASITVPYAVKASTDENGKSITTYVAELSTGNNKLIVKDGDGTTIAELTIPYATSALNDVDGDAIKSTYGTDLTTDTTTVQLRSKDGAIISTITVPYATKALSDDQGNNFRSNYGYNLAVDGNKVALESHDGTTLNEITVPFAVLATDATNAIESVSISGDEIVFTTYGGNSYRITSPYAVKALKDNLNNTITTTYVASVTNDPDTGEISFFASDGSLISTLIPTLDSAIHDSYGNLIGDFVKEIIVNPQNNYVVVNHGTGDSDTLTINYATHAYKDTYENVIGNTYIRRLACEEDAQTGHYVIVAYNGELSELFRFEVLAYSAQTDMNGKDLTSYVAEVSLDSSDNTKINIIDGDNNVLNVISLPVSKPDYIVYYLDFSNSNIVLDFTLTTSINFSGSYNAKQYIVVENGVKRTITRSEFLAFEKQGVKSFIVIKCKTIDNDGNTYTDTFAWEFMPAYVSTDIPNFSGNYNRKALTYGGNSTRGFGAGYSSFELISDTATTANFSYYRT